jgi:hypothetical protein
MYFCCSFSTTTFNGVFMNNKFWGIVLKFAIIFMVISAGFATAMFFVSPPTPEREPVPAIQPQKEMVLPPPCSPYVLNIGASFFE